MEFAPGTNKDASQTCQNRRVWALLSPIALPSPLTEDTSHPNRCPQRFTWIGTNPQGSAGSAGTPGRPQHPPSRVRSHGGGGTLRPPGPARPAVGTGQSPPRRPGVPELSAGIHGSPQPPGCFPAAGSGQSPPPLPGGPCGSRAQPRDPGCSPPKAGMLPGGAGPGAAPLPRPAQPGAEPPLIRAMSWAVSAPARPSPGLGSAQPEPPGRAWGPRGSLTPVCLPGSQLS